MTEEITIDNLRFKLYRSARRKTVGITVDRDGSLILRSPIECSFEQLERVVRAKLIWTFSRLAEKKLFFRSPRPKKFVNGEGFYYLGESYRLLLVDPFRIHNIEPLRLDGDWFVLRLDERQRAEQHFIDWYTHEARKWINSRVNRFAERVDVQPNRIYVRDLGFRWGSCTTRGEVKFHWRTVLLPPQIIDYVIVHELVHLKEKNHSRKFWQRIERVLPDYAERRQWLLVNGGVF
jgi:predicted metal-dependent hydrolase